MLDARTCRECGGRMERGFVVDTTYGGNAVSRWLGGAPVKRWWGLQVKEKDTREITSYRCERCGLLQSYVPSV